MTPHFFVAGPAGADEVLLDESDTRHLVTVLRARPGLALTVADGSGTIWSGAFRGVADGSAVVELNEATTVAPTRPTITVVHALPKQRKLDDVVQRLTEMGVDRIVAVHSDRSQVELDERRAAKAVDRWRAVALAAAKQSRRARLPEIGEVGTWSTAFPPGAPGLVAWEESTDGLGTVLDTIEDPAELVLGVGPEGGLTAAEVAASGLPHASLGRDILRTETAALVATAAVRYHYGLMEPA